MKRSTPSPPTPPPRLPNRAPQTGPLGRGRPRKEDPSPSPLMSTRSGKEEAQRELLLSGQRERMRKLREQQLAQEARRSSRGARSQARSELKEEETKHKEAAKEATALKAAEAETRRVARDLQQRKKPKTNHQRDVCVYCRELLDEDGDGDVRGVVAVPKYRKEGSSDPSDLDYDGHRISNQSWNKWRSELLNQASRNLKKQGVSFGVGSGAIRDPISLYSDTTVTAARLYIHARHFKDRHLDPLPKPNGKVTHKLLLQRAAPPYSILSLPDLLDGVATGEQLSSPPRRKYPTERFAERVKKGESYSASMDRKGRGASAFEQQQAQILLAKRNEDNIALADKRDSLTTSQQLDTELAKGSSAKEEEEEEEEDGKGRQSLVTEEWAANLSLNDFKVFFGLPSYFFFTLFLRYLTLETGPKINYLNTKKMSKHKPGAGGRVPKLSRALQVLFVLFVLRSGICLNVACIIFGISNSTGTSMFVTWLVIMHAVLTQKMFPVPSSLNMQRTVPQLWMDSFGTDRLTYVIDSTCAYLQCPSDPEANTALYQKYYGGTCAKYMVGTTPAGANAFASLAMPGSISDQELAILTLVGLGLLKEGDHLLMDKGFPIADILFLRYCHCLIPYKVNTVDGSKVFDAYQMDENRVVAHRRIHVERAIGSLKEGWRITTKTFSLKQRDLVSMVVSVCFLLNNFFPLRTEKKNEFKTVLGKHLKCVCGRGCGAPTRGSDLYSDTDIALMESLSLGM